MVVTEAEVVQLGTPNQCKAMANWNTSKVTHVGYVAPKLDETGDFSVIFVDMKKEALTDGVQLGKNGHVASKVDSQYISCIDRFGGRLVMEGY